MSLNANCLTKYLCESLHLCMTAVAKLPECCYLNWNRKAGNSVFCLWKSTMMCAGKNSVLHSKSCPKKYYTNTTIRLRNLAVAQQLLRNRYVWIHMWLTPSLIFLASYVDHQISENNSLVIYTLSGCCSKLHTFLVVGRYVGSLKW